MKLALDAMGGDNAPEAVIEGAAIFSKRYPKVEFQIFGDEAKINPLLEKYRNLQKKSQVTHTDQAVEPSDKASQAVRRGKQTSMWLAANEVAEGKCDGFVSAGNTGALMAISKLVLKTLPGIDRPAICSLFPSKKGDAVLLDLGANTECDAENLYQFGIMGEAFARSLLGLKSPSVGVLNIGSEDVKGLDSVKLAAEMLKSNPGINFHGFVEGHDVPLGKVDVVVTDGFSGNIALKIAEGTAKLCGSYIKSALRSGPFSLLGGFLARGALKAMYSKIDPRSHNGAMFLGLNGIAIKSHGGTDALGFANALEVSHELIQNDVNAQIIKHLAANSLNNEATKDNLA